MRRNKHIPAHFGTNAARKAQTRYLRGKTPESERVEKNREAAGHVISLCFMVALHDRYGIGKDRLDRVINAANGALERFAVNKRGVGMERAKKKLNEELEGLLTERFVLPASKGAFCAARVKSTEKQPGLGLAGRTAGSGGDRSEMLCAGGASGSRLWRGAAE
jgi:hypothetical protein